MGSYVEWAAKVSPGWLQKRLGAAWTETQAVVADILTDAAREAIKARFPDIAAVDALPYIASERGLEQWAHEAASAFRVRLREAWDAWVWAGTHKGITDQLNVAGYATEIRDYWDWPDPYPARWARFWVIVPQPHSWTDDGVWGDPPVWNDGGTWGSTATVAEVTAFQRTVRRWKAAHARCVNIIVIISGELWGYPGGAWSAPGVWGGAAAAYWTA